MDYADFGSAFNPKTSWSYQLLSLKYEIEISAKNPDYVIYSLFGSTHHTKSGIKIFFTEENTIPNFNCCDYALGFHHLVFQDRYLRLPLWRLYLPPKAQTVSRYSPPDCIAFKRKFCAMVVSNIKHTDGMRELFFKKLSEYKQVDSGGKYKNNVGGPVADKQAFLKNYKFSLAFENTSTPGYCTEKLLQAFLAGTVPIYYGDPTVTDDFNPKAFINCHDYCSFDDVIKTIRRLDQDEQAYLAMLKEPVFIDGRLPDRYQAKNILTFFDSIFKQPLSKARRCDFTKSYADVDYTHLKQREINAIFVYYLSFVFEKFKKKLKCFFFKQIIKGQ